MTSQSGMTSVFANGKMLAIQDLVARTAGTPTPVLIRGEQGAGKESLARAMHAGSPRADKQFIKANCAMFSPDALEAQLFGHEKGAFSSADRLKPGKLETAHQGTLLIEEIGDMALRVQGRLLQVVDHGLFTRVGGQRPLATDVRLIVSASIDLEAAVRAKQFREDLYYRLGAVEIVVPALRQRREEIPALVAHFVHRFNAQYGRATRIAPEILALFDEHGWPGNVDELEDAVRRLVIGGGSATVQRQLFDAMGAEPRPSRRRFHQPPMVAAQSDDGESVRARRRLA